jgi:hypothetical protein
MYREHHAIVPIVISHEIATDSRYVSRMRKNAKSGRNINTRKFVGAIILTFWN